MTAEELIRLLDLKPHPEGGFYRETYRSPETVPKGALPERYAGDRNLSTAILYLLPEGSASRLHRLRSDELWHFHLGGPLELLQLSPARGASTVVLGPDIGSGHRVQHAVPAGTWLGARPLPGIGYALAGCTVAPGFDFADFELGDPRVLLRLYPSAREAIERLAG